MGNVAYTDRPQKRRHWYNGYTFPLIPVLEYKRADKHNTPGFTFHWLFLKLWTMDHVDFELSLVCSTHWGFGFIGIAPYLRWVLTIPCPERLGHWISRKSSRKPLVSRLRVAHRY